MKLAQILGAFALSLLVLVSASNWSAATAAPQSTNLRRADFRVEGASCVSCLRRIAQTLKAQKGVLKADVSIYRPYWAIVIYDAKQTGFPTLKEAIKNENVKLTEFEEKTISEVPLIVIPKSVSLATGPKKEPATTPAPTAK